MKRCNYDYTRIDYLNSNRQLRYTFYHPTLFHFRTFNSSSRLFIDPFSSFLAVSKPSTTISSHKLRLRSRVSFARIISTVQCLQASLKIKRVTLRYNFHICTPMVSIPAGNPGSFVTKILPGR